MGSDNSRPPMRTSPAPSMVRPAKPAKALPGVPIEALEALKTVVPNTQMMAALRRSLDEYGVTGLKGVPVNMAVGWLLGKLNNWPGVKDRYVLSAVMDEGKAVRIDARTAEGKAVAVPWALRKVIEEMMCRDGYLAPGFGQVHANGEPRHG